MENTKYYDSYYGSKVSKYGLEHGKVDYACLREAIGDCVLCNNMEKRSLEPVNGEMFRYYDEEEPIDIYQWYIISDSGAQLLMRETDEIVFYDEDLDVYVWAVTHWGTDWDYVLTDIDLIEKN